MSDLNILSVCHPGRDSMITPTIRGDRALATNGHVLVSLPIGDVPRAIAMSDAAPWSDSADIIMRTDGKPHTVDAAELAEWAGDPWEACPCGGVSQQCKRCDGYGVVDCYCSNCDEEHQSTCRDCKGDGHSCPKCRGAGKVRNPQPGILFGSSVDRRLVALTLGAMGAEGKVDAFESGDKSEHGPIVFHCGERIGVVMGFRLSSESHRAAAEAHRWPTKIEARK